MRNLMLLQLHGLAKPPSVLIDSSTGQKTQYYVVVKDKLTGENVLQNGLEFLIGCRDYPDTKYDTCVNVGAYN